MGLKQSSVGHGGDTNSESIPTTSLCLQPMPSCTALHFKKLLEEELERHFRRFDTDGTGKIKIEEIRAIFSGLCDPPPVSDDELRALLSHVHADPSYNRDDGCIQFEELVMLITKNVDGDHAIMKDLGQAFSVFDVDGDGFISAEELHEVLSRRLGKDASMEQCRKIVKEVDMDDDRVISFEEFIAMMLGSSSPCL